MAEENLPQLTPDDDGIYPFVGTPMCNGSKNEFHSMIAALTQYMQTIVERAQKEQWFKSGAKQAVPENPSCTTGVPRWKTLEYILKGVQKKGWSDEMCTMMAKAIMWERPKSKVGKRVSYMMKMSAMPPSPASSQQKIHSATPITSSSAATATTATTAATAPRPRGRPPKSVAASPAKAAAAASPPTATKPDTSPAKAGNAVVAPASQLRTFSASDLCSPPATPGKNFAKSQHHPSLTASSTTSITPTSYTPASTSAKDEHSSKPNGEEYASDDEEDEEEDETHARPSSVSGAPAAAAAAPPASASASAATGAPTPTATAAPAPAPASASSPQPSSTMRDLDAELQAAAAAAAAAADAKLKLEQRTHQLAAQHQQLREKVIADEQNIKKHKHTLEEQNSHLAVVMKSLLERSSELKKVDEECTNREVELIKVKENLKTREAANEKMREDQVLATETLKVLEQRIAAAKESAPRLEAEFDNLSKKRGEVQVELNVVQKQYTALQSQLEDAKQVLKEMRHQEELAAARMAEILKKSSSAQSPTAAVSAADASSQDLQNTVTSLRTEVQTLRSSATAADERAVAADERAAAADERAAAAEARAAAAAERAAAAEERASRLQSENANYLQQLMDAPKVVQLDAAVMKKQAEVAADVEVQLAAAQVKLDQLQLQEDVLKRSLLAVEKDERVHKDAVEHLRQQESTLSEQMHKLTEDIKTLTEKESGLKTSIALKTDEWDHCVADVQKEREVLIKLQEEMHTLQNEVHTARENLENLETTGKGNDQNLRAALAKTEEQKKQVTQQEMHLSELKSQIAQLEGHMKLLQDAKDQAGKDVIDLEAQKLSLHSEKDQAANILVAQKEKIHAEVKRLRVMIEADAKEQMERERQLLAASTKEQQVQWCATVSDLIAAVVDLSSRAASSADVQTLIKRIKCTAISFAKKDAAAADSLHEDGHKAAAAMSPLSKRSSDAAASHSNKSPARSKTKRGRSSSSSRNDDNASEGERESKVARVPGDKNVSPQRH
jgi:hypothetical protein